MLIIDPRTEEKAKENKTVSDQEETEAQRLDPQTEEKAKEVISVLETTSKSQFYVPELNFQFFGRHNF